MAQTRGPQEAASTLPAWGAMVTGPPAPPRNLFLPRGSPLHTPLPPREGPGPPTELTAVAWPGMAQPRAPCVSQEDLLESGQRSRDESGTRAHTFWKIITMPFPEARAWEVGAPQRACHTVECPLPGGAVPRLWMPGYRASSSVGICGRGSDLATTSPWGGLDAAGVPDLRHSWVRAGSASRF